MQNIRNFCIIAHIDHGKSTLADRLLESTGTIDKREMRAQLLDDMDLERERGITIKSHAIQMKYPKDGEVYTLNLIDTPGHVDFSYEVSRAVAACEGALLVVDAAQGIEAQTLSNLYLALEQDLTIIPILNKIDLPNARVTDISEEIIELLGCTPDEIIQASAKEGIGIDHILEAILQRIPAPQGDPTAPLQAMVFDASYNPFRGVEVYLRLFNGTLYTRDLVRFMQTSKHYTAEEIGILQKRRIPHATLKAGDVGYLTANIRQAKEVKVGDTLTHVANPCLEPIGGFTEVQPMVFAGLYPVANNEYETLRKALEKLQLNDASLTWRPEKSAALGFGFHCGFLGMLHMDIVSERLTREASLEVIITVPSVELRITDTKDKIHIVQKPTDMLPPEIIKLIEEPMVQATIMTHTRYVGSIMTLCIEKRGVFKNQLHLSSDRVELIFHLPLGEIVFDFYDQLKSISSGYASLDYRPLGFVPAKLVKLDVLLNGDKIDALSTIVHRDRAHELGKKICEKAKDIIPPHMFEVRIQAAIGTKVVARSSIKARRKDVTAKLYGGDVTRKKKLLEAQKRGKQRMRQVGNVRMPKGAFLSILRVN
ncbi:MAG: translation elongation factor 4 [Bacteroidota bacterium]